MSFSKIGCARITWNQIIYKLNFLPYLFLKIVLLTAFLTAFKYFIRHLFAKTLHISISFIPRLLPNSQLINPRRNTNDCTNILTLLSRSSGAVAVAFAINEYSL